MDTRFTPEWLAAHPGNHALVDFLRSRNHAAKSEEQRPKDVTRRQLG